MDWAAISHFVEVVALLGIAVKLGVSAGHILRAQGELDKKLHHLESIPGLVTAVGQLQSIIIKMQSDHSNLRDRVSKVEGGDAIRDKFNSYRSGDD